MVPREKEVCEKTRRRTYEELKQAPKSVPSSQVAEKFHVADPGEGLSQVTSDKFHKGVGHHADKEAQSAVSFSSLVSRHPILGRLEEAFGCGWKPALGKGKYAIQREKRTTGGFKR
jgi:hypothetical protein